MSDIHNESARQFRHPPNQLMTYFVEHRTHLLWIVGLVLVCITTMVALFMSAPYNFNLRHTISIPEGATLEDTGELLEREDIIRSAFVYKAFNILLGNQANIQAGDFYFHDRESLIQVSSRIVTADYGLTPTIVRVPEGATVYEVSQIMASLFERFDEDNFLEHAKQERAEGYLFPDTYQFLPNVDEVVIFNRLRDTFEDRVASIMPEIEEFGHPLEDVVIMASIIEKESANDLEERRTISGILWNRIDIGMALQVDATFNYVNGKTTFELTTDDLTIDSPYNTYKYPGLPIGPISNPSLDSILAAVTPIQTEYLFYLHDRSGTVYYSKDFEAHKANKFKYLR